MKLQAHSRLVVLLEVFFVLDNYERGMTNVIRYTKGKRSITSSEEDRAHNKRKRVKKAESSSDNEEEDVTNTKPNYNTKTTPIATSQPKHTHPNPKSPKILFSPTTNDLPTPNNSPGFILNTPSTSKEGACCRLPQNRKHHCVFKSTKGVTLEAIGHALCVITST